MAEKETTLEQEESKQSQEVKMYRLMYKDGKQYLVAVDDIEKALAAGYTQKQESEEDILVM